MECGDSSPRLKMAAKTQTRDAIVSAAEAALKANADVTTLLGAGVDSIYQYQDENKLEQAIRNNPQAITPAICVFSADEDWFNAGNTHDRNVAFRIYRIVYDPVGFGARLTAANALLEKIYETFITPDQEPLGLTNPVICPIQPARDAYSHEMSGRQGKPLEVSVWKTDFTTITSWQP